MVGNFGYSGGSYIGALPTLSVGYAWAGSVVADLEVGVAAHDGLDASSWLALRGKWVFLQWSGGSGLYAGAGVAAAGVNGVKSKVISDIEGLPPDVGAWNVGGLVALAALGADLMMGDSLVLAPELMLGSTVLSSADPNESAYGCSPRSLETSADGSVWLLLAGLRLGFY
jgi:hypothetical protein